MADAKNQYRDQTVTLRDARMIFRNFTGRPGPFNSEGDRNFHVVLDEETAQNLAARQWRVKQMKDQEDGSPGDKHLKVKVNYNTGRPPRVTLVTNQGKTQTELGADEVAMLDVADIEKADLVLNGWYSDMAGGGFSAFLKTLFVTLREDELELLYSMTPAAANQADQDDSDNDNWNE